MTMLPRPTATIPPTMSVRGRNRASRIPATGPAAASATMNGIVATTERTGP